jgi:hypothetical protein
VKPKPELFKVVRALHATRGFASRLHSRQQEGDQHADDGDDH